MKGYTILIVDDDESTHDILGDYLELSGFNVLHASDGAQGLQIIETHFPDLVLLDIQMPYMDGFKTIEMVKSNNRMCDTQVIFLSTMDRANLKVKGLELGAEDYIVKPFNRAELLARVNAAIRRASKFMRVTGSLGGKLEDISLTDLLQTMDIGRKTATISLPEMKARIYIEAGALVRAEVADFVGQEALNRIFFTEKGSFATDFSPISDFVERDHMPIQSIMMNTLTYVDELNRELSAIASPETMVKIDNADDEVIGQFAMDCPMPLSRLVVLMTGDLKRNVALLAEKQKEGTLITL